MTTIPTCASCARDTEIGPRTGWRARPIHLNPAGLCAACVEADAEAHADDVAAVEAGRAARARLAARRAIAAGHSRTSEGKRIR